MLPDVQCVAKGLGGGFVPIGAVLVAPKVVQALQRGSGMLSHGQTFQSHVLACTVALKVQRIIEADGLVERCREQGAYLERCLQALVAPLPLVGNVRGRGLFWGVELVADKQTKRPLARTVGAAAALHRLCLDRGLAVYPPARAAPTKAPAGTMSC